eukprot:gnl/TRDRNA2_/TRDRNA2_139720_c0_seq1.p1 gnl/TRDRNA2_/TRDRNA2_139720_c0~~gnl/TRDRNA2_/TRDRNA2_139720_c0_seq1.p1  ORF type:complete len:233 (+),score=48.79 gnl/TRDRNA2_/TRDRNA2_139720_c0_seq1:2-700(+)
MHWLHTASVSVLFVFAAQILLLMLAYGCAFFKNFFFLLDAVVVGGALILELGFSSSKASLAVVLLSWRLGRIIHGLVSTVEINHKKMHKKIQDMIDTHSNSNDEAMELMKKNVRELGVANTDLHRLRNLLCTDLTPQKVKDMTEADLRHHVSLQVAANHDVLEEIDKIVKDWERLEETIKEAHDAMKAQRHQKHAHGGHKELCKAATGLSVAGGFLSNKLNGVQKAMSFADK